MRVRPYKRQKTKKKKKKDMESSLSPSPALPPHPRLPPSLPHPGASHTQQLPFPSWVVRATNLVVIAGGRLCRPKGVVIGPVAISLGVVGPAALLTRPAVTQRAFPSHEILVHTGHQGPASTPRRHVTEGLVDDTILSAEEIQAICRGNQPTGPCLRPQGSSQDPHPERPSESRMRSGVPIVAQQK